MHNPPLQYPLLSTVSFQEVQPHFFQFQIKNRLIKVVKRDNFKQTKKSKVIRRVWKQLKISLWFYSAFSEIAG